MKKVLIILLIVALVGTAGFLGYSLSKKNKDIEARDGQISMLQMQMANIQQEHQEQKIETVGIYRFKDNIPTGAEITEESVELVYVAAATYTDSFVKDVSVLPAIAARPCYAGTMVESNDLAYDPYVVDKKFTRELQFESLPVGLKSGEYVDIRYALPNGETVVVMGHLYCDFVGNNSISFKVSEEEWMLIDSAIRDFSVYSDVSLLYLVRYLDPGADTSVAFYPIATDLATFVTFNPNINDTTRLINPSLRNHIDEVLTLYSTNDNRSVASAYISGLANQFGTRMTITEEINRLYTDPETGEYKEPDFLTEDGSSIVNKDAFTDKVDDAIDNLEGTLADFEQAIN